MLCERRPSWIKWSKEGGFNEFTVVHSPSLLPLFESALLRYQKQIAPAPAGILQTSPTVQTISPQKNLLKPNPESCLEGRLQADDDHPIPSVLKPFSSASVWGFKWLCSKACLKDFRIAFCVQKLIQPFLQRGNVRGIPQGWRFGSTGWEYLQRGLWGVERPLKINLGTFQKSERRAKAAMHLTCLHFKSEGICFFLTASSRAIRGKGTCEQEQASMRTSFQLFRLMFHLESRQSHVAKTETAGFSSSNLREKHRCRSFLNAVHSQQKHCRKLAWSFAFYCQISLPSFPTEWEVDELTDFRNEISPPVERISESDAVVGKALSRSSENIVRSPAYL